jgi:hypothetical protein
MKAQRKVEKMKTTKRFLWVCIILAVVSCNIEDTIENASKKCEDEIAKVVQSVESVCLTKEEILEIIYSVRTRGDGDVVEEADGCYESR